MTTGPDHPEPGLGEHDEVRMLLGAYVLGGIDPDDRRRVDEHLTACSACRAELSRLAPLPGLLNRVPAEARQPQAADRPAGDLVPTLLARVRRDRSARRRRTAGWSVAAAGVATLTVLTVGGIVRGGPEATVVTLAAATAGAGQGEAELSPRPWGTAMTLRLADLPAGGPFTLEVVGVDGTRQRAATWGPTPDGTARVDGATSLSPNAIESVRVLGPDGPVLIAKA